MSGREVTHKGQAHRLPRTAPQLLRRPEWVIPSSAFPNLNCARRWVMNRTGRRDKSRFSRVLVRLGWDTVPYPEQTPDFWNVCSRDQLAHACVASHSQVAPISCIDCLAVRQLRPHRFRVHLQARYMRAIDLITITAIVSSRAKLCDSCST